MAEKNYLETLTAKTKKNYLTIALVIGALILIVIFAVYFSGAEKSSVPSSQPSEPAKQTELRTENRELITTAYAAPATNHFGVINAQKDFAGVKEAGITWDRAYPGPFNWEKVGLDKFDWKTADKYVEAIQEQNLNILATIWPFNSADQAKCYASETTLDYGELAGQLATKRRKPCDMDSYKFFVSALVERYDGDGVRDMPGLKYGIKHWEIASEPDVQLTGTGKIFFQGEGKDYAEILKASYSAVKTADSSAKVLNGAVSKDGIGSVFWKDVFYNAKDSFDIANYHCADCDDSARIQEFRNFISREGIDKPVWLTDFSIIGASDKEQSKFVFTAYLTALGKGADKVFYGRWAETLGGNLAKANIIELPSTKRPAFFTLKALIGKLDNYSSVKIVSDEHYEFNVPGKAVHAFLKSTDLQADLQGDVVKMDYNGTIKNDKMYNIAGADVPIVLEKA
ncbi:MAG TPA: hypothetical protein HA224_00610 [Nanoarchaeota archaeon]|nr:hypothetical protein [Nanoarchaeota archaeon]